MHGTGSANLKGKRVAIIGAARTGIACAKALRECGATAYVFEEKPETNDAVALAAQELRSFGVETYTDWSGAIILDRVDLVIPSPGVSRDHPALVAAVGAGVPVWSEIELAWRLARGPIAAITGTNGKSTTTALVYEMVRQSGLPAWLCGNIAGVDDEMPLVKAALAAGRDDWLVAEVSSFQLEWVHEFRPKVAVMTVLQPDHLNRYGGEFAEYARTKARLFAKHAEGDIVIINADDAVISSLTPMAPAEVYKFSLATYADGYVDEGQLVVRWEGERHVLVGENEMLLRGRHNVGNCLAAALAALAMGGDLGAIRSVLRSFTGLAHRMEQVGELHGVTFVNNSMCTNPSAVAASVYAVPGNCVLIAGGVDKGLDFGVLVGALKEKVRMLALIGRDAQAIADAVRRGGYGNVRVCGSLEEAVRTAQSAAQVGDTVMLAPGCASFDMFTDFRERGREFKRLVRQLMEEQ